MSGDCGEYLFEEKLGSVELFKGKFLHAFRDEVLLPNGAHASREYVVHPGAVMVIPLIEIAGEPPDGHFKFPHLWPVKFPQAGRPNYQLFGMPGFGFLSW